MLNFKEYRAVFSYPDSILGSTPDSYSQPVTDPAMLPTVPPRSVENHGWVSAIQMRYVSQWEVTDWEHLSE